MDNQVERSPSTISCKHFQSLEVLHLRYLTFDMRQFLWKTALFDSVEFLNYKNNLNGPDALMFMASRDEAIILHEITQVLSQDDWTGDLNKILSEKSENVQLLKQIELQWD